VTNAPVGISSAEIELSWTVRESSIDDVSYRGLFSADYTIYFMGEEPAIVEIAMLLPEGGARGWLGRPGPGQDFRAYVDGVPIETLAYIMPENYVRTGPENLAGRATPALTNSIDDVRAYFTREPYIPTTFMADEPATLYTFAIEADDDLFSLVWSVELTLSYDREKIIPISQGRFFTTNFDSETEKTEVAIRLSRTTRVVEILVIGDSILSWELEPDFVPWAEDDEITAFSDEFYIRVETAEETPREYFYRMQKEIILPPDVEPDRFLIDGDLLMGLVDEILMGLRGGWDYRWHSRIVRINDIALIPDGVQIPREPNVFIAAIPFQPGEERVFSVSFTAYSGMEWNREEMQSLFHHTILTEAAGYWDFFDELTVTAHHPEDVITSEFTDGFAMLEGKSVANIQGLDENIHMGFWLTDERTEPDTGNLMAAFIFIIFGYIGLQILRTIVPWILPIGAIILLVYVIFWRDSRKKRKKAAAAESNGEGSENDGANN
jgi:hypothetical protein